MNAPTSWREVTKDEFFRAMGPQDVHPSIQGRWPYTSNWNTRAGKTIGKTEDYLPEGSALTKTRYWLPSL